MSVHLKDVSSSSGVDSDSETNETENKQSTKYRCPSDFVSCTYRPCANIRLDNLDDKCTELWLIKAPTSFDPNCFSNLKIPLRGSKRLQAQTESPKMENYRILSNAVGTRSMHLLSACDTQDGVVCGPAISGLINICEDGGDIFSNQMITPLPASPAPAIPDGLKQRFTPFGCATPPAPATRRHKGGEGSHSGSSTKRAKRDLEEVENRKNRKRMVKSVKVEEEDGSQMDAHENLSCEATGKKKKKRDKKKERVRIKEEREIKMEPEEYA